MIFSGTLATAVVLACLASMTFPAESLAPVWLMGLVGFCMLGPYSYLAGAISLDLGGKQGSGTACGIIDGVGYLGAMAAGDTVARLSVAMGWSGALGALAGVALVTSIAGVVFFFIERKPSKPARSHERRRRRNLPVVRHQGARGLRGRAGLATGARAASGVSCRARGAGNALVVAALLHDIGHLVTKEAEDAADHGIDTRHEVLGQAWLARYFGPEVTEAIRLHVPAKRYLCATDAAYLGQLSPASVQSLGLQGGPFDKAEIGQFEANPHFRDAIALRRWDDLAKVPGMDVPPLDHYRPHLARAAQGRLS